MLSSTADVRARYGDPLRTVTGTSAFATGRENNADLQSAIRYAISSSKMPMYSKIEKWKIFLHQRVFLGYCIETVEHKRRQLNFHRLELEV